MNTKIKTNEGVKTFAKQLIAEDVNFHTDDDYNDCVIFKDNKPTYTKEEVDLRNDLMNQCIEVCENKGSDIYDVMLEVSLFETVMDKFIPLPSQAYPENN